jgi:ribosomal protein S27AE
VPDFEEKVISELIDLKAAIDKILNKVDNLSDKLNSLSSKVAGVSAGTAAAASTATPTGGPSATIKPSDVVYEQKEKEKGAPPPSEGRKTCPNCSSTQFTEVEDKTNVLHYVSGTPIYSKKRVCKQCGAEF